MTKTFLFLLCALTVAVGARAQQMSVVRGNGTVDTYNLADIDSVTFGVSGTRASLPLRNRVNAANEVLRVHGASGTSQFPVAAIDSVTFLLNVMTVHPTGGVATAFDLSQVDSLTFASPSAYVVTVAYSGTTATVVNPLESFGVAVAVSGADVIVTSTATIPGIEYQLSGTSTDGMFKIYSAEDFGLTLDGLNLNNANGPAINVQADVTIGVNLATGTTNVLSDGTTYATAPNGEDQKSTFFSEGQLIFTGGTGGLTVNSHATSAHGLCSDDFIQVESGTITIASAVKDAIHTNSGYFQSGGTVSVTGSSDGVDAGDGPVSITNGSLTAVIGVANKDALKCAYDLSISGGTIDITVSGNQCKGVKAANITQSGGNVTIHTSGGVVLAASGAGYDPSYCTAVKADTLVDISGGQLSMFATGIAGRGISSDGDIRISAGTVSATCSGAGGTYTNTLGVLDAYTANCLNADRNLVLSGGTITLSNSGSGGKGISGDANLTVGTVSSSPTIGITTTGTKIALGTTGEYAEAKTISVDSTVTFHNGAITITSADDGVKAKYRIDIYGGNINVTNAVEAFEAPYIYVYGGTVHAIASDDCLNATWSTVSGGTETNDGSIIQISGGYVYCVAQSGDGIDSNGILTISGGTVIVDGPASQPNVGLDVNGTFLVNGGFLICAQASGAMVESPSTASAQRSLMANHNSGSYAAGTLYHIETTTGVSIVTFAPPHNYSNVLLSTSSLLTGTLYRVYTGGTVTGGTLVDGIYTGGTYSGGTLRTTFTSSGTVQTVTF